MPACFARSWSGTLCWQAPSPYRQRTGRKNWLVIAQPQAAAAPAMHFAETDVDLVACRTGGPGGQHRNKASTAVRATHRPTGIVVVVDREPKGPTEPAWKWVVPDPTVYVALAEPEPDHPAGTTTVAVTFVGTSTSSENPLAVRLQDTETFPRSVHSLPLALARPAAGGATRTVEAPMPVTSDPAATAGSR